MLDKERGLYIAHCAKGALSIQGKMANRHGLIAGATGTGKTVTLQVMAETFCQAGVPCFMADMKERTVQFVTSTFSMAKSGLLDLRHIPSSPASMSQPSMMASFASMSIPSLFQ